MVLCTTDDDRSRLSSTHAAAAGSHCAPAPPSFAKMAAATVRAAAPYLARSSARPRRSARAARSSKAAATCAFMGAHACGASQMAAVVRRARSSRDIRVLPDTVLGAVDGERATLGLDALV